MISKVSGDSNNVYFNPERVALLTQVFKKTLIEVGVTSVIFTATVIFVASGSGIILLAASSVTMLIFNASIRLLIADLMYRDSLNPSDNTKKLISFLNYLAPLYFGIFTSGTSDTLIHETGHAIAANSLYINAKPTIQIDPFQGGSTSYFNSELSALGSKAGKVNAALILSAAGPILEFAVSATLFASSYVIQKSHPELSKYFFFCSINTIANQIFYALSTYWTPITDRGHDFLKLSLHGFSPLLYITVIVGVPILIKIAVAGSIYLKTMSEANSIPAAA